MEILMKVTFLKKTIFGRKDVAQPGDVREVGDEHGKALVKDGAAAALKSRSRASATDAETDDGNAD